MNEVYKNMLKRRSIRKFKSDAVKDEDIEILLKAAMAAPSACNKQPWEFNVVKSSDKLDLVKASGRYTNMNAPLAIVVCGNEDRC